MNIKRDFEEKIKKTKDYESQTCLINEHFKIINEKKEEIKKIKKYLNQI